MKHKSLLPLLLATAMVFTDVTPAFAANVKKTDTVIEETTESKEDADLLTTSDETSVNEDDENFESAENENIETAVEEISEVSNEENSGSTGDEDSEIAEVTDKVIYIVDDSDNESVVRHVMGNNKPYEVEQYHPANEYVDDGQDETIEAALPAQYGYNEVEKAVEVNGVPCNKTYYVVSNLPGLRSQGNTGTCWAHATIATAEAYMIQNGYDRETLNLSESQLAYFEYNADNRADEDSYYETTGDVNRIGGKASGTKYAWDVGGAPTFISALTTGWTGIAEEIKDNTDENYKKLYDFDFYNDDATKDDDVRAAVTADNASSYKDDLLHCTSSYIVNYDAARIGAIKNLVWRNNAAFINYYAEDEAGGDKNQLLYYSKDDNSYYCPEAKTPNHAVTIVGWNDNFSGNNFKTAPEGDGAWLIRNSWSTIGELTYKNDEDPVGTLRINDQYNSYDGYFWLSYYDKSIANIAGFDYVLAEEDSDHAYIYDGAMENFSYYNSFGSANAKEQELTVANVFTVKNDKEILDRVSFSTSDVDQSYKIEIYTDIDSDADNNPTNGTLASTLTGRVDYAGYISVPLDENVILCKEEKDENDNILHTGKYAVVITLTGNHSSSNASIEMEVGFSDRKSATMWYDTDAASYIGQGYYYDTTGGKWYDFKDTKNSLTSEFKTFIRNNYGDDYTKAVGNLRIRAFTSDYDDEAPVANTIVYHLGDNINVVDNTMNPHTYKSGVVLTLKDPICADYDFDGWYDCDPSDPAAEKITFIDGTKKSGRVNLYAKWTTDEFSITYENMEGAVNFEGAPASYTKNDRIILGTPTKPGYEFDGWYQEYSKDGETETFGNRITMIDRGNEVNATLYAKWKVKTHTLILRNMGGKTGESVYEVGTVDGIENFTLPTPSKVHYKFKNWCINEEGSDDSGDNFAGGDSIYLSTGDLTLYAIWEEVDADDNPIARYGLSANTEYAEYEYTGAAVKPSVKVYFDGKLLTEKQDYTITYKNNTNAYTYGEEDAEFVKTKAPQVVVTGKGLYLGTANVYFKINPISIKDNPNVSCSAIETASYRANTKYQPVPTVICGTKRLTNKKDFTVSYYIWDSENNKWSDDPVIPVEAGQYIAVIAGIGNYSGSKDVEFDIADSSRVLVKNFAVKKMPKTVLYSGDAIVFDDSELVLTYKNQPVNRLDGENVNYTVSYENNVEVGTATVIITGYGEYAGTKKLTFSITGTQLSRMKFNGFVNSFNYTGVEVEQPYVNFSVGDLKIFPVSETEYNKMSPNDQAATHILYRYTTDNVNIGTVKITYYGINGYTGTVNKTYTIKGKTLAQGMVVKTSFTDFTFDGSAKKQDSLVLMDGENTLTAYDEETGTGDYLVTYLPANPVNAGTVTATFTGKGRYTGTFKKTYKIQPYDIMTSDATIKLNGEYDYEAVYQKGGSKPAVTVILNGKYLAEDIDFTVTYENNKAIKNSSEARPPRAVIKGMGNYKGFRVSSFSIVGHVYTPGDGGETIVISAPDKEATGRKGDYKSAVTITDDGTKLAAGTDYKIVKYTDDADNELDSTSIVAEGDTVKVWIEFIKNYSGETDSSTSCTYRILGAKKDISKYTVTVKKAYADTLEYTGDEITIPKEQLEVTIGAGVNKITLDPEDYEIITDSYVNNVNPGAATATIKGLGDYGGTKTFKFTIKKKGIKWFWE